MPKIETTVFSKVILTEEDAEQLSELKTAVTELIESKANVMDIVSAYDELIEACFELHQYEMALEGLNYLKKNRRELDFSDAETADLHRKFGVIAFSKNKIDEAKIEFEKALDLLDDNDDDEKDDVVLEARLLCDLGNVAAMKEDLSAAVEFYKSAIELGEEYETEIPEPFINLGLIYLETEDIDDAIDCFDTALRLCDEDEELDKQEMLYLQLADIYAIQNSHKEALMNYHYASELQEENSEILAKTYVAMAAVLSAMAEHDKAIEYHEKALPILLTHGDIEVKSEHYFQLANLYSQYKEDYEKALDYHKKSLEISKIDTENKEWRDLMIAKLEDSIEITQGNLSKFDTKKSKKLGFFRKLFGK